MAQTEHRACYHKPETSRFIGPNNCWLCISSHAVNWKQVDCITSFKRNVYQSDPKPG